MWCRTILTAVAISYVICMLLLSGLQKEDLNASTLEKLDRHNVNIDDTNNEQLRQECLLESYSVKGNDTESHVTTEAQTEPFVTSTTDKRIRNVGSVEMYPKMAMRLAANFEGKTVVQNEVNINKTKSFLGQLPIVAQKMPTLVPVPVPVPVPVEILNKNDVIEHFHDLGNVTKVEANKGLQIEYNIQNQPDVQSIMNFWTKLTHYTRTVVTKLPTTPASPNISTEKNVTTTVKVESYNKGYVHSREMEFIGRILAEYLASQTVPTTTQKVFTKKVYTNYIPKKYGQISNIPQTDEEPTPLFPIKNNEQPLNDQNGDINKINNFTRDNLRSKSLIYNSMLDKTKSMQFKDTYDRTQQNKRIQEIPYRHNLRHETRARQSKPNKINNPIQLIDSLLQMKNEFNYNRDPVPDTESTTKNIKLLSNEQQEKKFNQYNRLQKMNDANIIESKNLDQNQNVMMNNDKSKSTSIELETWQPVETYSSINRHIKTKPIDKKDTNQMQKFGMYDEFKDKSSEINKVKRLKTSRMNTFDDELTITNKPEQIQNVNRNDNRIQVRRPDLKTQKLYQNLDPKYDRFKAMLPSIKNAIQNKNLKTTNYEPKVTRTELNKSEATDNVDLYGDQPKAVSSQQTAATEKNGRNQLIKMTNEQLNTDSGIVRNTEQNSKKLNENQLKITPAPVIKNREQTQDSINQIKPILESVNNDERKNDQLIPINVNGLKPTQNVETNVYEPQAIPANIIQEIAEKVKQIVLKDIEKDCTTTTASTTSSTTAPTTTSTSTTTTAPTTVNSTSTTMTTSEKPSTTLQKEITEANHVIQKLMEIFKEFKAMKDTAKLTSQMPPNTTILSYGKTKPELTIQTYPQSEASYIGNPYNKKTSPIFHPVQVSPYVPGMVSGPISSGANPQYQAAQYMPQSNMQQTNDHSGAITIQTNSNEIAPLAIQILKPLKFVNQQIVVTTKSSVNKLKEEHERESKKRIEEKFRNPIEARNPREKLKHQSDFTKQVRIADSLKRHEFGDRYPYKNRFFKDREKPWYDHEYNEKVRHIEDTRPVGSRFPEHLGHPRGLSDSESLSYPRGFNRHGFNQPRSHQIGMNHQPGSYSHSDYDRQPRYEATKFHEKLERIENWPRSTWKEFKAIQSNDNSCDEISARHQVPLMKVKQRSGFDDTHFTKFLKSQQKVTDMLEKILANNIKTSGPHSVETP